MILSVFFLSEMTTDASLYLLWVGCEGFFEKPFMKMSFCCLDGDKQKCESAKVLMGRICHFSLLPPWLR